MSSCLVVRTSDAGSVPLSFPLVPAVTVYLTTSDTILIDPICSYHHYLFDNVRYMHYRPHLFLPPLFIWQRQIHALSTPLVPTTAIYLTTSDTCFIDPTCSYHHCLFDVRYMLYRPHLFLLPLFIWQRQIQASSTPLVPTTIVYLTTSDTCFIDPTCSYHHCLFDNVRYMHYWPHLFLPPLFIWQRRLVS